jgi:hypothetical protein
LIDRKSGEGRATTHPAPVLLGLIDFYENGKKKLIVLFIVYLSYYIREHN